jgi:hypothetical protein
VSSFIGSVAAMIAAEKAQRELVQDQFYWKGKKVEDLTREELLAVISHLSFELRQKRNLIDYLANL